MRIILNSDVIYTKRRWAEGLPSHIEKMCRGVTIAGGVLVLPRTVLFEDQRHQVTLDNDRVLAVEHALATLKGWNVALPDVDVRKEMPRLDVVEALRATNVTVEVEEASLEEYREAERRASLHISPHSPEGNSDEMRDLIIWQVALRVAKRDGGAMIVSRDPVHVHERGSAEANLARLFRAKNFEEALEILARESSIEVRQQLAGIQIGPLLKGAPKPTHVSTPLEPSQKAALVLASALGESQKQFKDLDGKVLGYIAFFGAPSKDQLFEALSRSAVSIDRARNAAERLAIAKLITDTGSHYLVTDKETADAAALLVESEIIKLLEQG
jgi:hypothetical protein